MKNRLSALVRPNILNLVPYTSARDEFTGVGEIFLDANELPYGTLNRYPDPYQTAIKEQLSALRGVGRDYIFIGNGSDEVIDLAFRIFCEPGKDKVVSLTPSYGMYAVSAAINDVEHNQVPLTKDFQPSLQELAPYLEDDSVKIIFLCSPNNPTGNLIEASAIINILDKCKGLLVIDEAYIDFSPASTSIPLLGQYDNLIITQTMSKAWGHAAIRVGVAYAQPMVIDLFNKVKPPYNVSTLNQRAALQALSDQSTYNNQVATIVEQRAKLSKALENLSIVRKVYHSDANFILIEVNDADRLYRYLVDHGIIVRNRSRQVEDCLRITIGTAEENRRLINTLKNIR